MRARLGQSVIRSLGREHLTIWPRPSALRGAFRCGSRLRMRRRTRQRGTYLDGLCPLAKHLPPAGYRCTSPAACQRCPCLRESGTCRSARRVKQLVRNFALLTRELLSAHLVVLDPPERSAEPPAASFLSRLPRKGSAEASPRRSVARGLAPGFRPCLCEIRTRAELSTREPGDRVVGVGQSL